MPHSMPPTESRVGWHYNAFGGPDQDHLVVSDTSEADGCVTVENGAGQRFPVERSLIDMFAAPPGMVWSRSAERYVPQTANVQD